MSGEKTEQASSKRKKKAREDGQIAKSADFTGAFILIVVLVTIISMAPVLLGEISSFIIHAIETSQAKTIENPGSFLFEGFIIWVRVAGPIIMVGFITAFVTAYLQVGPGFSMKGVIPDGSKLNPGEGIKRLFSADRIVDLIKTLAKLGLVGAIAFSTYWDSLAQVSRVSEKTMKSALSRFGELFSSTTYSIAGALLVIGIADLLWQRHSVGKKIMMSKQEVKDEYKEAEGDPYIKSQQKALQRQLIREAGLKNLKKASAVVVNPTHVAAAIAYNEDEMNVPIVVTSGYGEVAARIRKEATRLGIPIYRDINLARALASLDLEEEIPEYLYDEVVIVLRYVYELGEKFD